MTTLAGRGGKVSDHNALRAKLEWTSVSSNELCLHPCYVLGAVGSIVGLVGAFKFNLSSLAQHDLLSYLSNPFVTQTFSIVTFSCG